ncbi:MAG: hypothetical protein CMJ90_12675 [Planctomycetes bacterium]|nr:hypothetical protein [Planctomycetota bacterium]
MRGVWLLSWRHLRHNRAQTLVLILCIAVPAFLPLATRLLVDRYEEELGARARQTPLIAGARGNRFDLVMSGLYFRKASLDSIPWTQLLEIEASRLGTPIPVNVRHTARERPIVGTSVEYYELRGIRPDLGTVPLQLGDVALGAQVARDLGLGPGDHLFSDRKDLYDIAKPPALKMAVCGVLAETGTPDDDAVFVDIRTTWILEGLVHGHDEAASVDKGLVLGERGDRIHLSPALMQYNEVTPANAHTFHYHGPADALPLSAVIVAPRDRKSSTLLKARFNVSREWQMLVPQAVIEELMGFVFKVKAFLDVYWGVLALTTLLLIALVVVLSTRLRAREMLTLDRIGCSRSTVVNLYAVELLFVGLLAGTLAGAGMLALHLMLPDLSKVL